jgi:hypothetical protein
VVAVYQQPSESAQRAALLLIDRSCATGGTGTRKWAHRRHITKKEIPATA